MSDQQHIPVLLNQVLEMSELENSRPVSLLDCTFGRGGHAMALADHHPGLKIFAVDQDAQAVEFAKTQFASLLEDMRLQVEHGSFHNIKEIAGQFDMPEPKRFDLILADLGVSSPQLDQAERGFSFQQSGPLDMRMNQQQEFTAADIVNSWSEDQLRDLFYYVGEVRKPGKVVKAILSAREVKPFETTLQLADLIAQKRGLEEKRVAPCHSVLFSS
ncbi:MAG: 16S rRNA (cytosine(1402)-N(4))-methyltransferase RsmH [Pseudomonadota bacterium]